MKDLLISVVVCAHRTDRYQDLLEAVASLKAQSYNKFEIILVIDGNVELHEKVKRFRKETNIVIMLNDRNLGLSESRNRGLSKAKGDIIAFFDDDAIADEDWLEELVRMYKEEDAIAAGGSISPLWITEVPRCLPQEFYWLIGATHKGFPEEISEVRNTFGSNLSFRTDILRELGGFRTEMGVKGRGLLQGEETEICDRMKKKFGRGVVYNQKAIVLHKIFPERLNKGFLLRRAFWQGYSKRAMKELGYSLTEEEKFLKNLTGSALERIKAISYIALCQLAFLIVFTCLVGLGYFYRAFQYFLGFKFI